VDIQWAKEFPIFSSSSSLPRLVPSPRAAPGGKAVRILACQWRISALT
jgi:hypothetical protein